MVVGCIESRTSGLIHASLLPLCLPLYYPTDPPPQTVMQNRPRRVLITSLAAVALLILGSLFLFSAGGGGPEGGRAGGREGGGVVEMDTMRAKAAAEMRLGAGPDGKLGVCYDPAHK